LGLPNKFKRKDNAENFDKYQRFDEMPVFADEMAVFTDESPKKTLDDRC
jgi:hypothetical protein